MAAGYILNGPAVSLNSFDVIAWERTKIVADRGGAWEMTNCETQQLVLDFRSNTVTLTTTLSRSGTRCAKQGEYLDKIRKEKRKTVNDVQVFTLVHDLGAL